MSKAHRVHPLIRQQRPPAEGNALQITEWLLRQPAPVTRGLVMNRPARQMSHAGRLYQAAMWRRYAREYEEGWRATRMAWLRRSPGVDRAECLRRARVNLYLAARLRRQNQAPKLP